MPDAYERTLPEVFPDFAPGNFTWDDELQGWVWTTFNEFQWDVNWANPAVLREYAAIILELANRGVDVLRLDAIAFMWKRLGTDCQGEPEVHAITQVLRAVTRIACPSVAFLAEAIVAPTKLLAYLGAGPYTGKVSDLAYHNSLMVQVWSMLAARDVRLAAQALGSLPPKPPTATWLTYLRCHDDIGWAIMDEDAAAVGVTGHGHRSFLAHWYAGDFPGSAARGLVFQYNPDTDDRRTSGSAASLIGLEAASSPAEVDRAAAALRLAHALVIGWGGIPVIWSGDELGQPNDPRWAAEPGHEEDNRWAHRPRLDWARAEQRHDRSTVAGRVFGDLVELVRARGRLVHLHGSVESRVGPVDDPGVLVTVREHPVGRFVGVYNVTPDAASVAGLAGQRARRRRLARRDHRRAAALGRRQRLAAALRRALAHHRPLLTPARARTWVKIVAQRRIFTHVREPVDDANARAPHHAILEGCRTSHPPADVSGAVPPSSGLRSSTAS